MLNDWLKRRIYTLICHPRVGKYLAKFFNDRIPSHGCIIDTTHPEIMPSTKAKLFWGIYERAEVRFVKKHLPATLDVIELGSSIGLVSSCIAKKLSSASKLVCVEADHDLTTVLKKNLALNAPFVKSIVIHAAIDYSGTSVSFDKAVSNTDGKVVRFSMGLTKIPVITLSQICVQFGITNYCLVTDIEGSEWQLFDNEMEALRNCRRIIAELHPSENKSKTVYPDTLVSNIVTQHGFDLIARRGNVFVFDKKE